MAHPKALFPILKNERGKQTQGLLRNLDIEGSVVRFAELKPTVCIDWHCAICGSDIKPPCAEKRARFLATKMLQFFRVFGLVDGATVCCPLEYEDEATKKYKPSIFTSEYVFVSDSGD